MKKTIVTGLLALAACAILMSEKANAQEGTDLRHEGLSTVASAPSLRLSGVGVHIGSHHFPAQQWNNSNPGVYLMADWKGPGVMAGSYVVGTYFNSERNQSVYLARNFNVYGPLDARWSLDLAVGAITGYKRFAVLPLVAPSVRVALFDGWSGRVHVLPKIESSGSWVVHLSVERKF